MLFILTTNDQLDDLYHRTDIALTDYKEGLEIAIAEGDEDYIADMLAAIDAEQLWLDGIEQEILARQNRKWHPTERYLEGARQDDHWERTYPARRALAIAIAEHNRDNLSKSGR